jgi:hypothetical protein
MLLLKAQLYTLNVNYRPTLTQVYTLTQAYTLTSDKQASIMYPPDQCSDSTGKFTRMKKCPYNL